MIEVIPGSATNKATVRLAGSVDIREANRLQDTLNGILSTEQNSIIDCSSLESLDCACVQLLLAAKRDSRSSVEILCDSASEVTKWFEYAGASERLKPNTSGQASASGEARS